MVRVLRQTSLGSTVHVHDCGFELIDHPQYSPGLAPIRLFSVPKLEKNILLEKGTRVMMTSFPL